MSDARMPNQDQVLKAADAQAYYDHFGKKQDSQGFYEDAALDDLASHADFEDCHRLFEFGCGTGKFAGLLFEKHLPASAIYFGSDISPVMVQLAKHRLEAYGERARVAVSDGAVRFPLSDGSVDRVVSTYVLDLLSEANIHGFFSESHRVLSPGGKVCIASLTKGVGPASRVVSSLWTLAFRLNPSLVGGCRPVELAPFVDPKDWNPVHRAVVTSFGVASQVLVLERAGMAQRALAATPRTDG